MTGVVWEEGWDNKGYLLSHTIDHCIYNEIDLEYILCDVILKLFQKSLMSKDGSIDILWVNALVAFCVDDH